MEYVILFVNHFIKGLQNIQSKIFLPNQISCVNMFGAAIYCLKIETKRINCKCSHSHHTVTVVQFQCLARKNLFLQLMLVYLVSSYSH